MEHDEFKIAYSAKDQGVRYAQGNQDAFEMLEAGSSGKSDVRTRKARGAPRSRQVSRIRSGSGRMEQQE